MGNQEIDHHIFLGPRTRKSHEEFLDYLKPACKKPPVDELPTMPPATAELSAKSSRADSSPSMPKAAGALPSMPKRHLFPSPSGDGDGTPPHEKADTEEDLLRRLERVFERKAAPPPFHTGGFRSRSQSSERSLTPPTSKASRTVVKQATRKKFDTSAAAGPRYGPDSLIPTSPNAI